MENEGTTILRNAGNRLPIEAASCPGKKAIPQVGMLENTLSNAAEICVMCRDDGSFHVDVNAKLRQYIILC
jgi:hypothetical protein